MSPQTPTTPQLRVFSILALLYGGLTLALLPWSHTPGPQLPQVIAASNLCIALAELCTAALLGREFTRDARPALLLLACAYVYSGVMALLHLSVFPGAILRERLFGNSQVTAWLFIFWRLGTASLFLATVLAARRQPFALAPRQRLHRLAAGVALSVIACGLVAAFSATLQVKVVIGTHFTGANISLIVLYQALCALTLLVIWRARGFGDMLYVWLALVLVASMTDQLLGSLSGAQYTIGWHAAKASSAISACLLLVFWLNSMKPAERAGMLNGIAAYVAAFAAVCGALLLRWFLSPWVGGEYPYATVYGAVAIAVWIGGWRAAAFAATLGCIGALTFFIDPIGELRIVRTADYFGLVMYVAVTAVIIGLGDAMRRAHDRLHASEELFRRSHDGALQGFALMIPVQDARSEHPDLEIRFINPAGAAAWGLERNSLIGRRLLEAIPDAEPIGLAPMLRDVVRSGVPADKELRHAAGAADRWYRHLAVPVANGVALSYIDVTDNKRLEAQLRQRAAELQEADGNKSRFLALLSHELRNPLAALANGVALLDLTNDPQMLARTRAMMQRQLSHLRRLIDDLLDLSRIDRGKLHLRREPVALDAAVRSAIDTARPGIDENAQALEVSLPEHPIYVNGDAVRLCQVVANLLNNAAKFTPQGGRIELQVAADAEEAVVRVKDDGVGFHPEEAHRIFDMFVQLDEARSRSAGGLGLGLTLVRSIVAMHGGRVQARSDGPGRGAEFCLWLPVSPVAPARDESSPLQQGAVLAGRVLVVDDNRDAADTLAYILKLRGFDVATFYNGEDALAHSRATPPDIAFIDLDMPGMTGFALARKLREATPGQDVHLVALTGMGRTSDMEDTRSAGFHAHLTKPAAVDDIVALAMRAASCAAPIPAG